MLHRYALLSLFAFPIALLAQPVNDLCTSVTPVALNVGSSLTFSGTRAGATFSNDGIPGNVLVTTNGAVSVWHAFTTTTCSNVTALYCNTPLPAATTWNFLTTTCPGDDRVSFSYADFGGFCANGQFGIQWVNLPAGTYYMPIHGTSTSGAYEIAISAEACVPGPTNDDCSGATPLTVGTACATVAGSVANGTLSQPANECNGSLGSANDDVWFSFVATGTEHTITMNGNGDLDAVMDLFADNCGSTTPIACADATLDGGIEEIEATDLTAGTTYYLRIYHYYTALAYDPTFTICVTGDIGTAVQDTDRPVVRVAPNPAQDRITIESKGQGAIRIMDLTGRTVWTARTNGRTDVDTCTWPRGTYLVSVEGTTTMTERIVLN